MQYKVETNVPIPSRDRSKYPFVDMDVGDSFLIPDPTDTERKRVQTSAASYGRRHNKHFVTRTTHDGIRVWRIE